MICRLLRLLFWLGHRMIFATPTAPLDDHVAVVSDDRNLWRVIAVKDVFEHHISSSRHTSPPQSMHCPSATMRGFLQVHARGSLPARVRGFICISLIEPVRLSVTATQAALMKPEANPMINSVTEPQSNMVLRASCKRVGMLTST